MARQGSGRGATVSGRTPAQFAYLPPSAVRDLRVLDDWRQDVADGFHEIEAHRAAGARECPREARERWSRGTQCLATDTDAVCRIAARWLPRLDDRSIVAAGSAVAAWNRTYSTAELPEQGHLRSTVETAMRANLALTRKILDAGVDYPVRDIEEDMEARTVALAAALRGAPGGGWPAGLDPDAEFDGRSVSWKQVTERLEPGGRSKTIEQRCRSHDRLGMRSGWAFLYRVKRRLGRVPQSALDAAAKCLGTVVESARA